MTGHLVGPVSSGSSELRSFLDGRLLTVAVC